MLVVVGGVLAVSGLCAQAADPERPGKPPNPIERTRNVGLDEGMPLFPSTPVAGHPGADPEKGWGAWDRPERVNYPGSVEHYRCDGQRYIHPINPCNHRTLVKNFIVGEMAGARPQMKESFAEPVQYVRKGDTPPVLYSGQKRPPVAVVRLKPGGDRLSFHLDPLPVGLYVVRIVGAIESNNVVDAVLGRLPKGLVVDLQINDGPDGGVNHYVVRQRGTDNFYGLGDFFFHVEDARAFDVSVGLHADSQIDLLVHNVDVHDVLAECAKRAGKKESILVNWDALRAKWPAAPDVMLTLAKAGRWADLYRTARTDQTARLRALRAEFPNRPDADLPRLWRQQRDELLWNVLPSLNLNYHGYGFDGWKPNSSTDPKTAAELEAAGLTCDFSATAWAARKGRQAKGPWELDSGGDPARFTAPWRLVRTLPDGRREYYTIEDLRGNKPFPGLPFQVYSWGKRFEDDAGKVYYFFPLAQTVGGNLHRVLQAVAGGQESRGVSAYLERGDMDAARDTALLLCRVAYDLPTYSTSHSLFNVLMPPSEYFHRPIAHQHRRRHYQFFEWTALAQSYDRLFPFIQGNEELAAAVGKHIPWVRTPGDVIALLDTYILQYGAREMMYFQNYYDHAHAAQLATLAAVQTDPEISLPWVKFIFSNTWEYPLPYASVEDYVYLTTQRDGTSSIGSSFYTLAGGIGGRTAPWLDHYVKQSGAPRYSLSDLKLYPRVGAFPFFVLENRVAGMHPPGIGDVGGPNIEYGQWWDGASAWMNHGWRWSKDPRFAWCVVKYGQRRDETDAEWTELQAAARRVERNPYMANRSRILSDWGGILEGGTHSDDFRFRHAVRVRVGRGQGHSHHDSLDLGLWSLGLIMSGDGGARGGYGRPDVKASWMHNVVTIDRQNWMGHAWVPELADMPGTQYMRVRGRRGEEFSRQVALVELDHGRPTAQPPSNADLRPGTRYGSDVTLPRAYVVDVCRTVGGGQHMYNFHGPSEDAFAVNVAKGPLSTAEKEWMLAANTYVMQGEQWGATVDRDVLTATWRMAREAKSFDVPGRGRRTTLAAEPAIMGVAYDPKSPRKHVRVHVPGQRGRRVVSGVWVSAPYGEDRTEGQWLRNVHVVRDGASSLFAAVWEPYAGEPFIRDVRLVGDPSDAQGPATLHVEAAGDVKDTILMDQSGAPLRRLEGGVEAQGRFAYLSRGRQGIRNMCLVDGKRLAAGGITITPERDLYEARVTQVDWLEKRAALDKPLPAKLLDGAFFEVSAVAEDGRGVRWTTFEAVKVEPREAGAVLTWRKGADCHSSRIEKIETAAAHRANNPNPCSARETDTVLTLQFAPDLVAGQTARLVVANQAGDRTARCDAASKFVVCDGEAAFKEGERVRLHEVGVGDIFRTATKVSLTRDGAAWRLEANVPCEITITATRAQWSADGRRWTDLPAGAAPGTRALKATAEQLAAGPIHLREP